MDMTFQIFCASSKKHKKRVIVAHFRWTRTTDLDTNSLFNDGNKELRVFTWSSQNLQEWKKNSPNRGHIKWRRGTSHRHEYDSLFYTVLYIHRMRISPNVRILADNLHTSVNIHKKHSMQEAASLVPRKS